LEIIVVDLNIIDELLIRCWRERLGVITNNKQEE
jgi:hypothetical protein